MLESERTLRKESSDPLVMNSVMIMVGWVLVTTPTSPITFTWQNWPMILASVKKSSRFFSDAPAFSVLMAITTSSWPGIRIRPLHTSPNSPAEKKRNLTPMTHISKSVEEKTDADSLMSRPTLLYSNIAISCFGCSVAELKSVSLFLV